jgi:hypothetical protein
MANDLSEFSDKSLYAISTVILQSQRKYNKIRGILKIPRIIVSESGYTVTVINFQITEDTV